MTNNQTLSLSALFRLFKHVEIPIIQRDYAQGRETARDLRRGLLDAIISTYKSRIDTGEKPSLNFDFVYGYSSDGVFFPIDGQQRLTTFFLLHWYTAGIAKSSESFRELFVHNGRSRLVYSVRPSTRDFLDQLVNYTLNTTNVTSITSLKTHLMNQSWFFLSWKHDPSIVSALNMLDDIHNHMQEFTDCFSLLTNMENPLLTFQLLNMDEFGLSDELYIKMNARGKPLSTFEQTKAKLEQYLSTKKQHQYSGAHQTYNLFLTNIESTWADMLWHYRDKTTNTYDEQFMSLLRNVLIVCQNTHENTNYDEIFQNLRDVGRELTFQQLVTWNLVNLRSIEYLLCLLEHWSTIYSSDHQKNPPLSSYYFDELSFLQSILNPSQELSYEQLVQLYAYSSYLYKHRGAAFSSNALAEWMRIHSNLAKNTIYNRPDDFMRSIKFTDAALPHTETILEFFSQLVRIEVTPNLSSWKFQDTLINGWYYEQQVREEIIKANLILFSEKWRELILTAESHSYFRGQIEFLFYFSGLLDEWLDQSTSGKNWASQLNQFLGAGNDDSYYQERFEEYYRKILTIFPREHTGVIELPDALWERALLTQGDYLQTQGKNKHFLRNNDRTYDWKRLLRGGNANNTKQRDIILEILDQLDTTIPIEKNLSQIIKTVRSVHEIEDWRKMLIMEPACIMYCTSRLIRISDDKPIFLLRGMRVSGEHAELYTFYVFHQNIQKYLKSSYILPFTKGRYLPAINAHTVPGFELLSESSRVKLTVTAQRDIRGLVILSVTLPAVYQSVRTRLATEMHFTANAQLDSLELEITHTQIEPAIKKLCGYLQNVVK